MEYNGTFLSRFFSHEQQAMLLVREAECVASEKEAISEPLNSRFLFGVSRLVVMCVCRPSRVQR